MLDMPWHWQRDGLCCGEGRQSGEARFDEGWPYLGTELQRTPHLHCFHHLCDHLRLDSGMLALLGHGHRIPHSRGQPLPDVGRKGSPRHLCWGATVVDDGSPRRMRPLNGAYPPAHARTGGWAVCMLPCHRIGNMPCMMQGMQQWLESMQGPPWPTTFNQSQRQPTVSPISLLAQPTADDMPPAGPLSRQEEAAGVIPAARP